MRRQGRIALGSGVVLLVACGLGAAYVVRSGFSARDRPSRLEAFVARRVRSLGVPSGARNARNPIPLTPEVLADARGHFADHCATCHANDGSGQTEIGQNLYPKAPDMRVPATQNLSDGELFYIIHNGIRLTGMPAWGGPDEHIEQADQDSWKLVHFIRHLPALTPAEITEMQALNPKSPSELQEEKEDQKFLDGSAVELPTMSHEGMKMPAAERPKHD